MSLHASASRSLRNERCLQLLPIRLDGSLSSSKIMRVPSMHAVVQQRAASLLAAAVIAMTSTPLAPAPALAEGSVPTKAELARLPAGLARIDLLLDNWDKITTVCNGVQNEVEAKQLMYTTGEQKCSKSPLKVQQYIGASSTLDPLFKADKLMIRAQQLVAEQDAEKYTDAVDRYIAKQQMASTMAYTSSWSGVENPNGSIEQIEDNLLEAKKEVLELRALVATVVDLLHLETF